jgi:sterol desaturase/sphingolipid hydroxylase (fatty acid hydroxylase superfamily)
MPAFLFTVRYFGLEAVLAVWLPVIGYWLFLIALAAAELFWPLHRPLPETKGRIVVNFAMGLLNAALFTILPLSGVLAAEWARRNGVGLLNGIAIPAPAAFVVSIGTMSLAAYWLHRLEHAVPFLWRMHCVHHCDTAVDLSTGFRNHPFETLFMVAALGAVAVALGLSAPALIAYGAAAGAFALWSHANLRLPARCDRALRAVAVTPTMHHIHHSARRAETDSNFGEVFSLWDRLFGTYRALDENELAAMRVGLGDGEDRDAGRLLRQLGLPLRS